MHMDKKEKTGFEIYKHSLSKASKLLLHLLESDTRRFKPNSLRLNGRILAHQLFHAIRKVALRIRVAYEATQ